VRERGGSTALGRRLEDSQMKQKHAYSMHRLGEDEISADDTWRSGHLQIALMALECPPDPQVVEGGGIRFHCGSEVSQGRLRTRS